MKPITMPGSKSAPNMTHQDTVDGKWTNQSDVYYVQLTASQQIAHIWGFDSVFNLTISSLAFIFNMVVLITIISQRTLRTVPFSVYQIHLTFVNILYILIHDPLHIISTVDGVWWMGDTLCNMYQYAVHIVCAATTHTHLLITLNRIWAIGFPFSYRTKHSIRMAAGFCFGMWIYLNVLLLPRNIMDSRYYRLPLYSNGCVMNFALQRTLSLVLQFVCFDMPAIVMVVAYPYIYYKHIKSQTIAVAPLSTGSTRTSRTYRVTPSPPVAVNTHAVTHTVHPQKPRTHSSAAIYNRKRNHGFLVLSWLTVSVLVCWVPLLAYYSILQFVTIDVPLLLKVANILYVLQVVVDPIILIFAQSSLRHVFLEKLHRSSMT